MIVVLGGSRWLVRLRIQVEESLSIPGYHCMCEPKGAFVSKPTEGGDISSSPVWGGVPAFRRGYGKVMGPGSWRLVIWLILWFEYWGRLHAAVIGFTLQGFRGFAHGMRFNILVLLGWQ